MKINKKESKTVKDFLDFMEKHDLEKVLNVRLEVKSKRLSFGSIPISYSITDSEGNVYNPDDLVHLKIEENKKLGLTSTIAIVGVKKGVATFKNVKEILDK